MFRTTLPIGLALLTGCAQLGVQIPSLAVNNSTPTIAFVNPVDGDTVAVGITTTMVAIATDAYDDLALLTVTFTSDVDGELCVLTPGVTGVARCAWDFSPGAHAVTVDAVDVDGKTGSATIQLLSAYVGPSPGDEDGDGYLAAVDDCDDANPIVYPGAPEIIDGHDNDCDGFIDEGSDTVDDDGDGFSDANGDCNDVDPLIFPGQVEVIDGVDQDCDRIIDNHTVIYDDDGDGLSENDGDCDDAAPETYPGATELPDGMDNNCDGIIDENTVNYDDDGDGFAEIDGDCDDVLATVFPGQIEIADGIDQDCNGIIDDNTNVYDDDGDGFAEIDGDCDDGNPALNPLGVERTDLLDNNCNGTVDELDGAYAGTMFVSMTGQDAGNCNGPVDIIVDELGTATATGTATCRVRFFDAVTLDGVLAVGGVSGNLNAALGTNSSALTTTWTGTFAGDQLSGSFAGIHTDPLSGTTWTYTGLISATR